MKKKFLLALMVVTLGILLLGTISVSAETEGAEPPAKPLTGDVWDGTVEQPSKLIQKEGISYYEITKCSELAYIAQADGDWRNYNYILANNLILNDMEISFDSNGEMVCTGDLEDCLPWSSITSFSGIFDGANYVVNGVYIPYAHIGGLFGSVEEGTVKNLTVTNSYIKMGTEYGHGGIVGELDHGTVDNCVFYGYIFSEHKRQGNWTGVGGIVGDVESYSTIRNCVNYGRIVSSVYAGGIFGNGNNGSKSTVSGCVNYGEITGTASTHLGGICGSSNLSGSVAIRVEDSVNFGNVSGIYGYCGGIAGYGTVSRCKNYGSITMDGESSSCGGVCGRGIYVDDSYNYGTVQGGGYTGGISGMSGGAYGCYNFGEVKGYGYCGGIGGYALYWSSGCSESANLGSVTSSGENVGGILGGATEEFEDVIENCYNTGDISGKDLVGGLVGNIAKCNILHSYNVGRVTAEGTEVGLIAPSNRYIWGSCQVENVYYLSDGIHSGFGDLEDSTNVVEGKTLAELKDARLFSGWDFEETWEMEPYTNDGLPYLKKQEKKDIGVFIDLAMTEDRKTITVTPNKVEKGAVVLLCLFGEEHLKKAQSAVYDGEIISFQPDEEFEFARVFVWDDFGGMSPVCAEKRI